jgi:hypothetical protein
MVTYLKRKNAKVIANFEENKALCTIYKVR